MEYGTIVLLIIEAPALFGLVPFSLHPSVQSSSNISELHETGNALIC